MSISQWQPRRRGSGSFGSGGYGDVSGYVKPASRPPSANAPTPPPPPQSNGPQSHATTQTPPPQSPPREPPPPSNHDNRYAAPQNDNRSQNGQHGGQRGGQQGSRQGGNTNNQSNGPSNGRYNNQNRNNNRGDNRNGNQGGGQRGGNRQDGRNSQPHHSNNQSRAPRGNESRNFNPNQYPPGFDPSNLPFIKPFMDLTSIDPQPRLTLEYPGCPVSCRLIDLFCPIGRGQRGLIVSPPKAGKTTLLKDIAGAVVRNHPDVEVIVLLVDERPEEVTDFRRTFAGPAFTQEQSGAAVAAEMLGESVSTIAPSLARSRVQVLGSSNDHPIQKHIDASLQTIEMCKRMVEGGKHVVVLLDSLTRLGRAFNQSRKHANSGRTMSGGLDSKALEVPRQIFGSARNAEEAGSLTIIASCLVDTGSQADQIIFEEFKGSGNMELILDRKISERRLFPAINLAESGTRKENLLLNEQEMQTMTALRRRLLAMPPPQQVEQLLAAMKRYPTNAALVGGAQ